MVKEFYVNDHHTGESTAPVITGSGFDCRSILKFFSGLIFTTAMVIHIKYISKHSSLSEMGGLLFNVALPGKFSNFLKTFFFLLLFHFQ